MQVKNENELISVENITKFEQNEKERQGRINKTKISGDSQREKLNSNLDNSDSLEIFNSYQEEDINNNNNNYIQEQIKNKIFHSIDNNENKNNNISNMIEDDLEKFYEKQQMEMEKALKKNSNLKSKSKEKSKSDYKKVSKNSFNNNIETINANKNSIISSNYNNNFNTSATYFTQNNNNNNLKNMKSLNTNSSINFKDLNTISLNNTKDHKSNMAINNKHVRNNSDVVKRNVTANNNISVKTSFVNNSPPKRNEIYKSHLKSINKSYSKNSVERNTSNKKSKIILHKITHANDSNIIDNSHRPKINISSANVNNSTIIKNKISYEDFKTSFSGQLNEKKTYKNQVNQDLKKCESTNNISVTKNTLLEKNSQDLPTNQNPMKLSGFKDYSNNKNNVHNIIKMKISHNIVEEPITLKVDISREKKNYSNYTSIFDKKKKPQINNMSNANISANISNSGLNNKPTNFLTIQEPESYVNKLQIGNTFRKNTANLKIKTSNNSNLSANITENLNNKNNNIGNFKIPITTGILSVKSDKAPIKISAGINTNNNFKANDKSLISKTEKNNVKDKNKYKNNRIDLNTDLANYFKNEKEKNSYTYLLHKSKNTERDSKTLNNKKHDSQQETRNAKSLRKLNSSVDAVVSNGKYNNIKIKQANKNIGKLKLFSYLIKF